ncbi:MAG: phytanoyl-CoA dioxygenase family protein [Lentisphaerae bacterium]|nr:phytanoyl-CoA dioxygenase family protein [Lentisphaerota bacterium]
MSDTEGIAIAHLHRALSQEQIDSFMAQGYLSLGRILDDDTLALLRQEYDAEFKRAQESGRYRNLAIDDTNDLDKKRKAPVQMLQIMQMCERNIHFRKILHHERLLDIVSDLIGPNIQLFHDQALYKPAHHGGAVYWHQDNGYWHCTPANLISCWMTLDDVTAENGAMQVIPGSHLQPVRHGKAERAAALYDIEQFVDKSKAVVVDLPAGGAMIHHCQTLHYTQPNTTDRQRRAFITHYMTPGTRRDGQPMPVSFERPMLRMSM